MVNKVYNIGIMIFIVIISAFLILNIFFRNVDYYSTSIIMNAFFIPFICAIGAFISVTKYSKYKKILTFRDAFRRAFIPMFIGVALSLSFIFIYITYIDTDTKDLLNHQYIESYKKSLEDEYATAKKIIDPNKTDEVNDLEKKYAEGKIRIEEKIKKNEDMFSLQYFLYVFAGFNLFFIILSVFFGSFFRTRTER